MEAKCYATRAPYAPLDKIADMVHFFLVPPNERAAMTDNVEDLVLEHLRAIRSTQGEHGDRLNRIELRLSAIEQTLGSLYALSGSDRETINSVIRRIERIERRLELSEDAT